MDDVHETAGHSHAANVAGSEAVKIKLRMQETMTTSRARPAQVIAAELMTAPSEVRAELCERESLRRECRRWKRGAQLPEPMTLADVDVPDCLRHTGGPNPQIFMIHDSGSASPRRMLVFSSQEQLRHLATSSRFVHYVTKLH